MLLFYSHIYSHGWQNEPSLLIQGSSSIEVVVSAVITVVPIDIIYLCVSHDQGSVNNEIITNTGNSKHSSITDQDYHQV